MSIKELPLLSSTESKDSTTPNEVKDSRILEAVRGLNYLNYLNVVTPSIPSETKSSSIIPKENYGRFNLIPTSVLDIIFTFSGMLAKSNLSRTSSQLFKCFDLLGWDLSKQLLNTNTIASLVNNIRHISGLQLIVKTMEPILTTILPLLPRLKILALHPANSKKHPYLDTTLLIRCSSLQEFRANINIRNITPLSNCTSLSKLVLIKCPNLKDFSPLNKLVQLTSLFLAELPLDNLDFMESLFNLKEATISKCKNLDTLPSLQGCKSLTSLTYEGCGGLTIIPPLLAPVRILVVNRCCYINNIEGLSSCPSLEELTLGELLSLEDISPLTKCTSLRKINFPNNSIASLTILGKLPIQDLSIINSSSGEAPTFPYSSLTKLHLANSYFDGNMDFFRQLTNLRDLTMDNCFEAVDWFPIGSCISLEKLSLSINYMSKALDFLPLLTKLRYLYIGTCMLNLSNISNCHLLEELYIERTQEYNLDGLNCASLTKLTINRSPELVNISAIAKLPLKELILNRCPKLTNLAICPSLEYISILGDNGVIDLTILVKHFSLTRLELKAHTSLKNIASIGECLSLKYLTLHECDNFEDLSFLAPIIGNLVSLDVSYSTNLFNIYHLIEARNLETLNVSNCRFLETLLPLCFCSNLRDFTYYDKIDLSNLIKFLNTIDTGYLMVHLDCRRNSFIRAAGPSFRNWKRKGIRINLVDMDENSIDLNEGKEDDSEDEYQYKTIDKEGYSSPEEEENNENEEETEGEEENEEEENETEGEDEGDEGDEDEDNEEKNEGGKEDRGDGNKGKKDETKGDENEDETEGDEEDSFIAKLRK
jgi:hypothetical protein